MQAAAGDTDDDDLLITPERMVGWRSIKQLRNLLDKDYLFMGKDYITMHAAAADADDNNFLLMYSYDQFTGGGLCEFQPSLVMS